MNGFINCTDLEDEAFVAESGGACGPKGDRLTPNGMYKTIRARVAAARRPCV